MAVPMPNEAAPGGRAPFGGPVGRVASRYEAVFLTLAVLVAVTRFFGGTFRAPFTSAADSTPTRRAALPASGAPPAVAARPAPVAAAPAAAAAPAPQSTSYGDFTQPSSGEAAAPSTTPEEPAPS